MTDDLLETLVTEGWLLTYRGKAHYYLFTKQVASLCDRRVLNYCGVAVETKYLAPADEPKCKTCAAKLERLLARREKVQNQ